ncbi:MAG: multiprotein bridging factor aMBF1 [Thermoplasmata archaeon]
MRFQLFIVYRGCGCLRCELCGAKTPKTRGVLIEGIVLNVCSNCAKFGEGAPSTRKRKEPSIVARRLERRQKRMRMKDVYEKASSEDLVVDYPDRIRKAREKRNLSQKELASVINEKWSVVNKLETGDMRPSDSLVLKLEKTLNIKLKEKVQEAHIKKRGETLSMTLADLLKED